MHPLDRREDKHDDSREDQAGTYPDIPLQLNLFRIMRFVNIIPKRHCLILLIASLACRISRSGRWEGIAILNHSRIFRCQMIYEGIDMSKYIFGFFWSVPTPVVHGWITPCQ